MTAGGRTRQELLAIVRDAPSASSPAARSVMQRNRRRDSRAEVRLRSALHAMGLRFRIDHPIRCGAGRPIRPDVVFTRARVAVFVDGCFWHGCPSHGRTPGTNTRYWEAKVELNRERDARQTAALIAEGWTVLRIWEHEQPAAAAKVIAGLVAAR